MLKLGVWLATPPSHTAVPAFGASFTWLGFAASFEVEVIAVGFTLRIGGGHTNQLRWHADQIGLCTFATTFATFGWIVARIGTQVLHLALEIGNCLLQLCILT